MHTTKTNYKGLFENYAHGGSIIPKRFSGSIARNQALNKSKGFIEATHSQMELKPWSSSSLSGPLLLVLLLAAVNGEASSASGSERPVLRFSGTRGEFKILQIADMHYADGRKTKCLDVLPEEAPNCSDLNTTAFIYRVVKAENPDLIVFTG